MNVRTALAAGAAIAAMTAAFAAPGVANAAATTSAPTTTAATPVSASDFLSASGRVTYAAPRGVVPSRTAASASAARQAMASENAAATASCKEPNCNLTYHGGPIQHLPQVYLMFWGPKWRTNSGDEKAKHYLVSFYKGVGKTQWALTASQYWDRKGQRPAFRRNILAGMFVDAHNPPKSVSTTDLAKEAIKALRVFNITHPDQAQVVIASQSGTCFSKTSIGNFVGNCGRPHNTAGYCGFHSYVQGSTGNLYLPVIDLPYQPDAGQLCRQASGGTFSGFSVVGGHETAETATDPEENAWIDRKDKVSGGEIADKCVWGGSVWGSTVPHGTVKMDTGTFPMQSLWSNAVHGCVMTGTLPLHVAKIGTQHSVIGHAVHLVVDAKLGGNSKLHYRAVNLPTGLSISSTGVISGKPRYTAGTYHTRVIVSYYAGWLTLHFTWMVDSVTGQVKGYDGKCADAYRGHTANGTKVDIWTCNGKSQQQILFTADGHLHLLGKCVTAGKSAYLEPCKVEPSQRWRRNATREYIARSSGKCLTDPGYSKRNGQRLNLTACGNNLNQHWSLP